jgi:ADP-heptose:LPS heptosyltransferase
MQRTRLGIRQVNFLFSIDGKHVPLLTEKQISKSKRLLFMTHLALGDFVYHGPLLKALKKAYPHLQIDIWMDDCRERPKSWRKNRSDILESWISQTGIADLIFPIATKKGERETLVRRASRRNYDIIFYLVSSRLENFAKVAYDISNTALIVGNSPESVVQKLKSIRSLRRVTHRFSTNLHSERSHIFEKYQLYYEHCFGDLHIESKDSHGLNITIPDSIKNEINDWYAKKQLARFSPLVMINPISTSKKRDLHGETLGKLVKAMLEKYPHIHILLNVPPSSQVGMKGLLKNYQISDGESEKVSVFSAEDEFFSLPAIMQKCDFVVTVETSVMHIAASLNVPQLAIVRRTASQWQPLRANGIFWCEGDIIDCDGRDLTAATLAAIDECCER